MKLLDIHMKLFGWYYRLKTKQDTLKKMKVRTKEEILLKRKQFESMFLLYERSKQNSEIEKYKNYLTVLKWVMNEEVDS